MKKIVIGDVKTIFITVGRRGVVVGLGREICIHFKDEEVARVVSNGIRSVLMAQRKRKAKEPRP